MNPNQAIVHEKLEVVVDQLTQELTPEQSAHIMSGLLGICSARLVYLAGIEALEMGLNSILTEARKIHQQELTH